MSKLRTCGFSALAALVLTASAYADAILTVGNVPQHGEENVLFHNPTQTCTVLPCTVSGTTNHTGTTVDFTSMVDLLTAKGGQSDVDAVSGSISELTISLPSGLGFKDLIIDPQKINADLGITAIVDLNDVIVRMITYGRAHGMPGQNFLTIVATGNELIENVTLMSPAGFNDLKQTRISGIGGVVIPEPSSMMLLGSGLLVLTQVLRRRLLKGGNA